MAINLGGGPYYHHGGIPKAVSMWIKTTTTTVNQVIAAQCDTGTSLNGWNVVTNNTSSGRLKLQIHDGSGIVSDFFSAVTNFNDGNWHHLAANLYFTNGSSSEIWLDGALVTSGACTGAWSPSGATDWTAGKSPDNFWGTFPGSLADIAGFTVNLSAAQILSLSKGFSAKRVLPSKLNCWIPVIRHTPGTSENDDKTGTPNAGAASLSNTGSESYAEHPRLYF